MGASGPGDGVPRASERLVGQPAVYQGRPHHPTGAQLLSFVCTHVGFVLAWLDDVPVWLTPLPPALSTTPSTTSSCARHEASLGPCSISTYTTMCVWCMMLVWRKTSRTQGRLSSGGGTSVTSIFSLPAAGKWYVVGRCRWCVLVDLLPCPPAPHAWPSTVRSQRCVREIHRAWRRSQRQEKVICWLCTWPFSLAPHRPFTHGRHVHGDKRARRARTAWKPLHHGLVQACGQVTMMMHDQLGSHFRTSASIFHANRARAAVPCCLLFLAKLGSVGCLADALASTWATANPALSP